MDMFPTVETWQLRKSAVQSEAGIVVSQNYMASDVGAKVLAEGGNAVDAAIATSFAISAVEPWMSGLGGGGYMQIYLAKENRVETIDFGMVSPSGLDPERYKLVEGTDSDLFSWPSVSGEINVMGPHSIAVPGQVAGMALSLEQFGTRDWQTLIAPAIKLAEEGLAVDWYATLKIASNASELALYPEAAKTYLPQGFAPAADWTSPLPKIQLGNLHATLTRLSSAGYTDFYCGKIAEDIVGDMQSLGSTITLDDMSKYRARVVDPLTINYRDSVIHAADGLTAGPTLDHALEVLGDAMNPQMSTESERYVAYANALRVAYDQRLASIGHAARPTSTTHLSVVDTEGNLVALTQTLLSVFGSRVMLPKTGVLMNNGIMWFDPRSSKPNSIAPGARPLCNMCPVIVQTGEGYQYAMGASGGRRIMPAVMQLISSVCDFGADIDTAMHSPRIDYSGTGRVTANNLLSGATISVLQDQFEVDVVVDSVYPSYFACPNVAGRGTALGTNFGSAFINSPWAKASIGSALSKTG